MGFHDSDGPSPSSAAILVAAGSGVRMGAGVPKALIPLAGRPLLAWSLAALASSRRVGAIVVAAPAEHLDEAAAIVRSHGERATVVAGGAIRSESVAAGLDAIPAASEIVLVHDAARPLLSPELVDAVIGAVVDADADGAIAARPVADTLKRADGAPQPLIAATVDRAGLWAAETPQAFWTAALLGAVAAARAEGRLATATDCASLVEAVGGRVRLVRPPGPNLKVTTPADLALAEQILRGDARRELD
jgi:2-C-methyl-D-erythritol 4-phosphate cytidylyltransferase